MTREGVNTVPKQHSMWAPVGPQLGPKWAPDGPDWGPFGNAAWVVVYEMAERRFCVEVFVLVVRGKRKCECHVRIVFMQLYCQCEEVGAFNSDNFFACRHKERNLRDTFREKSYANTCSVIRKGNRFPTKWVQ